MSKKLGKNLPVLLNNIERHLDVDCKLNPYISISKGLLEETVREGRRYIRTHEKKNII